MKLAPGADGESLAYGHPFRGRQPRPAVGDALPLVAQLNQALQDADAPCRVQDDDHQDEEGGGGGGHLCSLGGRGTE